MTVNRSPPVRRTEASSSRPENGKYEAAPTASSFVVCNQKAYDTDPTALVDYATDVGKGAKNGALR